MTVTYVSLGSHIETATHALPVHDGNHQGRLGVRNIVVSDLNGGRFVIDENSLDHSDQISQ